MIFQLLVGQPYSPKLERKEKKEKANNRIWDSYTLQNYRKKREGSGEQKLGQSFSPKLQKQTQEKGKEYKLE